MHILIIKSPFMTPGPLDFGATLVAKWPLLLSPVLSAGVDPKEVPDMDNKSNLNLQMTQEDS